MKDKTPHSVKRRHWGRFSLRFLLVVFTLTAILLGWNANAAHRQRAVVAKLQELEVRVHYDPEHRSIDPGKMRQFLFPDKAAAGRQPAPPDVLYWLRERLGEDFFQPVTAVTLWTDDPQEVRALLPLLEQLPQLREIYIPGWGGCGLTLGPFLESKDLLERSLPGVKVTSVNLALPIVG